MNKIFLLLLMPVIFMLTGCGQDSPNAEDIGYKKVLTVGLDAEYAPFGFRDTHGEIIGFDVDLAKETARRIGVEIKFQPIDWSTKEDELDSGRIDLIWNGLDITPERKARILYSKPYMDNRQILVVKLDSDFNMRSEYDLADKIVGTQAGSNSETYILQNESLKSTFKEFKTYPNFKAAFEDLDNGIIDVLIVDELAGRYEMRKIPPKFEAIEVTVGPVTEIGLGFRKDNTELRDKVQGVFDDMIKDGTARKISVEWFQADLIKSQR